MWRRPRGGECVMHCWYAPAGLLWSGVTGSPPLARLHREALKQAATDPKTGIIDIGILTTGVCWFVARLHPWLRVMLSRALYTCRSAVLNDCDALHWPRR